MPTLFVTPDLSRERTPDAGPNKVTSLRRCIISTALGAVLSVAALTVVVPGTAAAQEVPTSINMKLLVIAATEDEPSLGGIKAVLDQVNVPYDVLIASTTPLTERTLSDGQGNGKYQGIMLTTGSLAYNGPGGWQSAFTDAQWQILWNYEKTFRVRQATLYTYPGYPDNYCLTQESPGTGTDTTPVATKLTAQGKQVFNYLNPNLTLNIQGSWTYLAKSNPGTNAITPLLSTSDGSHIASICAYSDGRQNLTITTDNNQYLLHTLALGYGVVNWVSKGFFIGNRQVYINPQPDDFFFPDAIWDPVAKRDDTGLAYRMTSVDYYETVNWQNRLQSTNPLFKNFRMEMPFNGEGVTGVYDDLEAPGQPTLFQAAYNDENFFKWISHTYRHPNLDFISSTEGTNELKLNNQVANWSVGMGKYFKDSLIQPQISGLNNSQFTQAAYTFGIRNMLCDLSKPSCKQDKPNTGYYMQPNMLPGNATQKMLVIPRYAANLYYNVSLPMEWESEYNHFYAPGGLFPTFDRNQTMDEIIDRETDWWLRYMMEYSIYSVMFHQPNLRFYTNANGVKESLLTRMIDRLVQKYTAVFSLPVMSPSQHAQADKIKERMTFNESGATGLIKLNGTSTSIQLQSTKTATIPTTGLTVTGAAGATSQDYGGQVLGWIPVTGGTTVTLTGPAW